MAFQRAFINLTLAVDLDGVPGNCDKPEDFVTIIEHALKGIAHYKPEITVNEKIVKPYKWDETTGEKITPTLFDEHIKPKLGDKTSSLSDGLGEIISIDGHYLTVQLDGGTECLDFDEAELTWNESDKRWNYGDLDRK